MGNKKYLIFIAVMIFSAVLFLNRARAQQLPLCNSFEVGGTCKANNDCPVPPNTIKPYPQVAICPVATEVCCVASMAPPPLPTCASFGTATDTASCKLISLCVPASKQRQASDCGEPLANVCCVEPKTPPPTGLCSSLGGTCKADCLGDEKAQSGTFSDCLSGAKCCKKVSCTSLGAGITCKPACSAIEEAKSGTFYDCTGANITCCGPKGGTPPPATPTAVVKTEFVNPIICTTAQCVLESLLVALQGVVAIIAIVMIVIGGMIYMFAGVNEKSVELGKKMIGGAVIGLAIVVAAPAFLKELIAVLGPTALTTDPLIDSAPSLKTIAERILQLVLSIAGILGIIGLIVGGGYYMTAYGDEDRMKKAKMIIGASLTGIIFAMAALVIVRQIANLLG